MAANDIMSLEDQARIELTLKTREAIIGSFTKDGTIPKDPSDRGMLMSALDGLDRTVLSKAKIKSDDNAAKSEAETARGIAELLLRIDSRRKPAREMSDVMNIELPGITLVEGETYIGVQPVKYSDIMGPDA